MHGRGVLVGRLISAMFTLAIETVVYRNNCGEGCGSEDALGGEAGSKFRLGFGLFGSFCDNICGWSCSRFQLCL